MTSIETKSDKFKYSGDELEVFKHAKNWKTYYKKLLFPEIEKGNLLEVGAGLGEFTRIFFNPKNKFRWIALEPDRENADAIIKLVENGVLDQRIEVFNGFVEDLPEKKPFLKTVMFIDSLEHIECDEETLNRVTELMLDNAKLIIVAPAHNILYSEFDKKIGHFRRYNKDTLLKVLPKSIYVTSVRYIDSAGFFLSLANKYFLKSSDPNLAQILFWDRFVLPISTVLDFCLGYRFGKNIVLVGQKRA